MMATMAKQTSEERAQAHALAGDDLRAEVSRLRSVCAQAYQLAGLVGAPEKALDILWAAADGKPLPHGGEFLPLTLEDLDEVRDLQIQLRRRTRSNPHAAALGRAGGSARSEAKARASAENGRKGGRPRKVR